MNIVLLYVTAPDPYTAKTLALGAITSQLAACANILPSMKSIYVWDDKLNEEDESVLILKTRAELIPKLMKWIEKQHPYEVPCMLEIPIPNGHKPYMEWLMAETEGGADA